MEQTKKSRFNLLFYLKKNELKKNGNAPVMVRKWSAKSGY